MHVVCVLNVCMLCVPVCLHACVCMCVCACVRGCVLVCLCPNTKPMHKTHNFVISILIYIYTPAQSTQACPSKGFCKASHSTVGCWQSADLHSWQRPVWTKTSGSKGPYAHTARTLPAKRKAGHGAARSSGL